MAAAHVLSLVNGWETIRYELLNTRLCDLDLHIEGSPVEPYIRRLNRELAAKGLEKLRPQFYLTDGWGCPDQVPLIGIPFYLADKRLARIEEEQTGEIEDPQTIMMLLRHESGHAVNYAYRLWEEPGWEETFGRFTRPYRDTFRPNPFSRQFVRHISHHQHGRTYAQKHPDEDFAETFAVWLTPRSNWRRKYRYWPAIRKLRYVDQLMRTIRGKSPKCQGGEPMSPVEEMTILLAEHYGQRAEKFRADAQGYVDDKLKEVFPETRSRKQAAAADLLRRHLDDLVVRVTRWSGLEEDEVRTILAKLEDRCEALGLSYPKNKIQSKLMDLASLGTSLAMNLAYTGRLTG